MNGTAVLIYLLALRERHTFKHDVFRCDGVEYGKNFF
jgi:hypothetical protein